MANAVAEDQILKVHRATDGSVWYIEGDRKAARSPLGLEEFPRGPEASRSARIRMLGTWDNAPMIVKFYAMKLQRKIASIAVASPMVGLTNAERDNPQLMLARMRNFPWPSALGGYHEVGEIDHSAYLLANLFQFGLASRERVERILDASPLWRYVSFVPHLDRMRLASVIATILDPRWYARWDADADEYNAQDYVRASDVDARRLNLFLGLEPTTMAGAKLGGTSRREASALAVLSTWKTTQLPPAKAADDPHYFLWRQWRTYDAEAKADLRVSQLFVDFLRMCWHDAIYMSTIRRGCQGKPDGLFAPDHFFDREGAAAFRTHMATGG